MKKFTRIEPEFIGGPLTAEFPDDCNVSELLDNGWVLADKKDTPKAEVKTEAPKTEVKEEPKAEAPKAKAKKAEPMF